MHYGNTGREQQAKPERKSRAAAAQRNTERPKADAWEKQWLTQVLSGHSNNIPIWPPLALLHPKNQIGRVDQIDSHCLKLQGNLKSSKASLLPHDPQPMRY